MHSATVHDCRDRMDLAGANSDGSISDLYARCAGREDEPMVRRSGDGGVLHLVERLVALSRCDWKYADLYLNDARKLLPSELSRESFAALQARKESVAGLSGLLRAAIQRHDWGEAERLATRSRALGTGIDADAQLLELGQAVYGRLTLAPTQVALALGGAVPRPVNETERDLAQCRTDLHELLNKSSLYTEVYEQRAVELARVVSEPSHERLAVVDRDVLRDAALSAAESADFEDVLRVVRYATSTGQDEMGRVRVPRPPSTWSEALAAELPDSAVSTARAMGMERARLESDADLNAYLSCRCAESPMLPSTPLSLERIEPESCTCGHACPPGVGHELKRNLDTLMVHPFLSTGGTRYLPWFGAESMFVESFDERRPDERTALLEALSLPRRQGISRLAIDDALLSSGPKVCEYIGLDPSRHRLVCIPFDAYVRLARSFDWGRQEIWTHFDGYQVMRDLRLQALVGGDRRFGGPEDLCGVGLDYESEHITARFAIVRRERFDARQAGASRV